MKKVLIALLLIFIAVPAKADLGDHLKEIGIGLLVTKVLEKDTDKDEFKRGTLPAYEWKGRDYRREYKVKYEMDRAILERRIRNCVERGECDNVDFRR